LDGVSIHPITTKIQATFLTQLLERKETAQRFHHEPNGDFKTVAECFVCDRRKLRMDQQHCSYSTILSEKKEACIEYTYYKTYTLFATRQESNTAKTVANTFFVLNAKCYVWGKSISTHY
jgi:hypothetical protein